MTGIEEFPATLEEAVNSIAASLDQDSKERLLAMSRADLVRYHHGWGTGIRNELGLWGCNEPLLADCGSPNMHPDDASMVIMNAVWNRLHGLPVSETRIANYKPLGVRIHEIGPEAICRRMRFRSSGRREKEQNIYRMLRMFFEMSYSEFKSILARVDTGDPSEEDNPPRQNGK